MRNAIVGIFLTCSMMAGVFWLAVSIKNAATHDWIVTIEYMDGTVEVVETGYIKYWTRQDNTTIKLNDVIYPLRSVRRMSRELQEK